MYISKTKMVRFLSGQNDIEATSVTAGSINSTGDISTDGWFNGFHRIPNGSTALRFMKSDGITQGASIGMETNGTQLTILNTTASSTIHVRSTGSAGGLFLGGTNFIRACANTGTALGAQIIANATSWSALSDRRLKQNIEYLQDDVLLQEIIKLKPVTYNWKELADLNLPSNLGLIAQDVKEVGGLIEKVVSHDSLKDRFMITETQIIPHLIGAVKCLTARIEALESNQA